MSRQIKIGLVHIVIEKTLDMQYQKICEYIDKAKEMGLDIVCFPELALGYGAKVYDKSKIIKYQENILSLSNKIQIIFSSIRYDVNSKSISCFVCENRETLFYDKIYLGAKEKEKFVAGNVIKVFENSKSHVRFSCFICYDMHFPKLCQLASLQGANLIIVPHLMPRGNATHRLDIWKKYMGARAYDNRVYVLAINGMVNGTGGGAAVWDMEGSLVTSYSHNKERILTVDIDLDELDAYRTHSNSMEKRFFLKDLKEI